MGGLRLSWVVVGQVPPNMERRVPHSASWQQASRRNFGHSSTSRGWCGRLLANFATTTRAPDVQLLPGKPRLSIVVRSPRDLSPQDLPTWWYTVLQALPPSARHRGIPPANRTAQLSCRGGPRLAEWLASMSAYVLATVPCALFDLESTEGYWPVVVTVRARLGVLRQVRRCARHHPKVHTFGWSLGLQ